ncbi:MAG: hypothetical protein ACTHZD_12760, partial [Micrococcaceae bacterium]
MGGLVLMSGWMGADFSKFELDEPIGEIESNAIQSAVETFKKASGEEGKEWTVHQLAEWCGVGGFGPIIVGSGETVAKELARIQNTTADRSGGAQNRGCGAPPWLGRVCLGGGGWPGGGG